MKKTARILIVDDESPIREVLSATLKDEGHTVYTASDGESGISAMREHQPQLVFLDIWMPGSLDGIEVLMTARRQFPNIEFVMISGHGTIETAVRATKLGAWDFIEKPLSMDKISIVISNIIQYQGERDEKTALLNRLRKSIALLGETPKMIALKQMIAKVAPQQSWVLLDGEHGSGKELVAQNIHYLSSRASRPFIEFNASAIPEDIIDFELFGYERGAFAGAEKTQKGKLELAQGGTVFLDDIAELSMKAQEKLLKIFQEKKFQRIGGTESVEIDIRLIAATRFDLEKAVAAGKFSEALYHRINVAAYKVPSLRDHAEDIPVLVEHFSDHAAKEGGFMKKLFSANAMELMTKHNWPGNVRELKNFIERVYILTPEETIDVHDLRFAGLTNGAALGGDGFTELPTFREARAKFEKEYLLKKIQENNGNISRTAEVIGLERSYLHRKIKAFGIEVQKGNEDL
jgi:two-component system, NtrC family, nitrogen regulation response regulator NtrX